MSITIEDLRQLDLLAELDDEALARWAEASSERILEPGDCVVRRGETDPSFVMLLDGRVDVVVTADGGEDARYVQTAPTWMGATLVLTGETATVDFKAVVPSRVGMISPEDFRALLFAHRDVFRRVMNAFRTLSTRIDAAELQKEKLAALGTMSAGLAHELGNPAAAALRTASALGDAVEALGGIVGHLVEAGADRDQAAALVRLHRQAMERAASEEPPDALAASDAEEAMAAVLEQRGVPDRWRYAEPLAAAGIDEAWMAEVAHLAGPALPAVVEWVAASVTARGLAGELRDATERMSRLVKAIKAYSYMDQATLQEVDVHEGLEATITMMGHKLKHTNIAIERRYGEDLPRVCVYGSELNQVWTNLLDNAIDALDSQGTITITTQPWRGDGVRVSIADDGPGIPEDQQNRVFEPFFTTKAVGAGTGLGLDTARQIVIGRHDGDLRLTSKPGETVFTVCLPQAPQPMSQ